MTYTEILTSLRKAGFRVSSKETTDGARKAWLTLTPTMTPKREWLDRAEKAVGALRGQGYKIEYQDPGEYGYEHPFLFVACTRNRPRGAEWQMGLDC